ncbi:phosphate ABC transporter substrate-binding protein [Pseudoalteromonas sp. SG45-5]|jgi:ABC-type phosphate transport system substrate-binding protein|uniref:phosphate ABC transporter substrate-binding protein n=1 Tax=unclassified Pseudoalteromonas TaxID=194690 RepID=UPI00110B358E|nr:MULTISPECIES: phosphate ABC transporter substrate-binding protein [unclassified Pseudoalteromonas]MBB1384157.1 phosphate ABC transporter substrate-binding protein [Pseudoalteromonas sp. SG45-5]MBB1392459.1 phosphate ABC transporter substrate-binding protein [Pseudoalteromonas sp. SG44-4]MBB1446734.1 phosphate ABC transporter substrate-binding protein [Pseudoalteromonas sp. SG41-6]TMO04512.1 phosphate ABC transporter substrate-binding protein [Pseudoalteromonas sp. S558]
MKKLMLAGVLSLCSVSVFAEVAVIINPSNTSTIDIDAIKKIYLGKNKSFDNGTKVSPVDQNGTAVADEFNDKVVGKSSSQINAYWSKLVFTGKGTPPGKLDSDQAVIDFVAANKDAIGYIDSAKVSDKVKVIATF